MENEPTHAVSSRTPSTHIHRDSPTSDIELSTLAGLSTQHTKETTTVDELMVTTSNERESEASVTTSLLSNTIKPAPLPSPSNTASPTFFKKIVLDTWTCETLSIVFSMACVGAVAVVVGLYDGEPIPQFPSGITLNTIISILSTAARSALVYVLSATVGQLKWHWFSRKGHRLRDMQALDDASRGPLGSIVVLFSFMGSSLAIIGGIVMMTVVAFGPFLQQVLEYPTRAVEAAASEPQIIRNSNYSSLFGLHETIESYNVTGDLTHMNEPPGPELTYAIKAGLYSRPEIFELTPTCTTSNCSWDSFKSVGWCAKCEDLVGSASLTDCDIAGYHRNVSLMFSTYLDVNPNSSVISTKLQNSSLRLPPCTVDLGKGDTYSLLNTPLHTKGANAMVTDLEIEAIWPVNLGNRLRREDILPDNSGSNPLDWALFKSWSALHRTNTSYMGVPDPLAVFGHVSLRIEEDNSTSPWNISIKNASRCLITLCERQYEVRVEGGATQTHVLSTSYGNLFLRDTEDGLSPMTCWQAEPGPVALSRDTYSNSFLDIDRRAFCPVDNYGSYMLGALRANTTTILGHLRGFSSDGSTPFSVWPSLSSNSDNVGLLANKDLKSMAEGIAASLTNYGLRKSNATVAGRAFTNEIYVHVRWVWIILPAFLEVATLILFLATVVQSHRAGLPTWKSSVLAVFYHDESSKDAALPLERLSDMDKAAGSTTVRLVMDPRVGHVLRRDSTDHQQSAA